MAEFHTIEDEALRYVMGQFGEAERRKFEARMEKSPELCEAVRELEAGAMALTLAIPQHLPPAHVWRRIEDAVAREVNRNTASQPFWPAWLRNGWAAAAACLVGWIIYGLWVNRAGSDVASPNVVSRELSHVETSPTNNLTGSKTVHVSPQPRIATNASPSPSQMSLAALGQIAGLRRQVTDLEAQVRQLSQMQTQQQALLADPGRLKFFHLLPTEFDGITGTNMPPPSPALQRALLLAVARELGWLRPNGTTDDENIGVDFVDLPLTGTNPPITTQSAISETQQAQTGTSGGSEQNADTFSSSPPPGAIPGYVSPGTDGNSDLVLALDPRVLPSGTASFSLWGAGSGTDGLIFLGTLAVGNYPQVITVHGMDSVGVSVGNTFLFGPTNFNSFSPTFTNAP